MNKISLLFLFIIALIVNCTPTLQSSHNTNRDTNVCNKKRPEYSNDELKGTISTNGIGFPTASAQILKISYQKLDSIFVIINSYDTAFIFEISVHSDKVGDESINCKLSMERANAIREYLVKKGIKPERLIAQGYSSNYPVSNRPANNRRIEINLLKKRLLHIME
jgi:outer membrane protein OmpA-like peptidoglycan-associated protein